jgi:hypothetical protein
MRPMPAVSSVALLLALPLGAPSAGLQRKASVHGAALTLTGSAQGLYPGARVPLRVTIRNRRRFPVRVLWLGARVVVHRRGCEPSNITVRRRRLHLVVPARHLRTVALEVSMKRDAPDACKGVAFRLWFQARGLRP